jgi:arylamine N-acetyltransferase
MVVQLRTPKEHKSLRGRVLRILSTTGTESRILSSADELLEVLSHHFSLDVPQAEKLWPGIIARHEQVFPD